MGRNILLKKYIHLERFHLAISSHLMRARDTALAILEHHNSIELEQWKVVKERCFGHLMEGNLDLIKAQSLVEDAVQDRTLLNWRPPGGQTIVDIPILGPLKSLKDTDFKF